MGISFSMLDLPVAAGEQIELHYPLVEARPPLRGLLLLLMSLPLGVLLGWGANVRMGWEIAVPAAIAAIPIVLYVLYIIRTVHRAGILVTNRRVMFVQLSSSFWGGSAAQVVSVEHGNLVRAQIGQGDAHRRVLVLFRTYYSRLHVELATRTRTVLDVSYLIPTKDQDVWNQVRANCRTALSEITGHSMERCG